MLILEVVLMRSYLWDAFQAEVAGALRAIEIFDQKRWNSLWIESYSQLLVVSLQNQLSDSLQAKE